MNEQLPKMEHWFQIQTKSAEGGWINYKGRIDALGEVIMLVGKKLEGNYAWRLLHVSVVVTGSEVDWPGISGIERNK